MNPYRLLAIDFDGTLLCPKGTVTPRTRIAIHRAIADGYIVCFATGRNHAESRQVLRDIDHHAPAVFVGGALVIDASNNTCLHRSLMNPNLARELCELFESQGHAALALQDSADGYDYLITDRRDVNPATAAWMALTQTAYQRVDRLSDHPHTHTLRVGIVASSDEIRQLKPILAQRFSNRTVFHSLLVPFYEVEVLEAFDPLVSKWAGVQIVAKRHNIAAEQIIAIGDDVNDIPMIVNAGLGVAMGNAHPDVRAIAKRTIKTNHQEGLAEFVEELLNNKAGPAETRTAAAAQGGSAVFSN